MKYIKTYKLFEMNVSVRFREPIQNKDRDVEFAEGDLVKFEVGPVYFRNPTYYENTVFKIDKIRVIPLTRNQRKECQLLRYIDDDYFGWVNSMELRHLDDFEKDAIKYNL